MNKDIRLLTTFPRHPKSIKLKRILGTWEPVIVLWLWAAENKPSGDLKGMENEDIAIAANWQDDPLLLIDALLKVRFLENTDNGAYCLHGWKKHNAYAANSEKRSEKARLAAQARWNKRLGECPEDAKECSEDACSNAPSPNPSPNPSPKTEHTASVDADEVDFYLTKKKKKLLGKRLKAFNLFWESFNYKTGKAEAADSWLDIPFLTDALVDKIIKAAKLEALNRKELKEQGTTPKMAQGWLSGKRWEDEVNFKPQTRYEQVG